MHILALLLPLLFSALSLETENERTENISSLHPELTPLSDLERK
jgi:hypothetical protein